MFRCCTIDSTMALFPSILCENKRWSDRVLYQRVDQQLLVDFEVENRATSTQEVNWELRTNIYGIGLYAADSKSKCILLFHFQISTKMADFVSVRFSIFKPSIISHKYHIKILLIKKSFGLLCLAPIRLSYKYNKYSIILHDSIVYFFNIFLGIFQLCVSRQSAC